jgi:hypothetical protein
MWNPYKEDFDKLREEATFAGEQWFGRREQLVEQYSWAVPNEEVIDYLTQFDAITEVGAGSGYWAKCVNENGGTVYAVDKDPPDNQYVDVKSQCASSVETQVVLLVWPPYDEMMAATAIDHSPNHVLYVGEPMGGCTANRTFFEHLQDEYGLVERIDLPSYEGVHDEFYHYIRKV